MVLGAAAAWKTNGRNRRDSKTSESSLKPPLASLLLLPFISGGSLAAAPGLDSGLARQVPGQHNHSSTPPPSSPRPPHAPPHHSVCSQGAGVTTDHSLWRWRQRLWSSPVLFGREGGEWGGGERRKRERQREGGGRGGEGVVYFPEMGKLKRKWTQREGG